MNVQKRQALLKDHKDRMLVIRDKLAKTEISLAEAALAEVEELGRITKALKDAV